VIRVEADATQRLWMFGLDGTKPELVLRDVKPIGYHAWASDKYLAIFVLGQQGQPPTLQVAEIKSGVATTAATNIGRSLQRVPGGSISFVQRHVSEGQSPKLIVSELDVSTKTVTSLVEIPAGVTDADTAWTPDGLLLVAIQGKLFGWRRGDSSLAPVADLTALGIQSATRIAVSPKGDRVAIVGVKALE
jgi:hypothetical protein